MTANNVATVHGLIEDHTSVKDVRPHKIHGWGFDTMSEKEKPQRKTQLQLRGHCTYYGYVQEGFAHLHPLKGGGTSFKISAGMFFRCPGGFKLQGGKGVVVECFDQKAGFVLGGPINDGGWDFFGDTKMVHYHIGEKRKLKLSKHVQMILVARGNGTLELKGNTHQTLVAGSLIVVPGKGTCAVATDHNEMDVICFSPDGTIADIAIKEAEIAVAKLKVD